MALSRARLAKVLRMLDSPADGERLAALAIATKILREEGLTWETALLGREVNSKGHARVGNPVSREQPSFYKPHVGMSVKEQMEFVSQRYRDLSMSDRILFTALRPQVDRGVDLSPRNQRLLHDLVHKLKGPMVP